MNRSLADHEQVPFNCGAQHFVFLELMEFYITHELDDFQRRFAHIPQI